MISHMGELRRLRKSIDTLDAVILSALKKRSGLSRRIGSYKLKHGLPLLDKKRFSALLQSRLTIAKTSGLSSKFVRSVFMLIHRESLRIQKKTP